ncbi:sperm flagellar protein 1-like isoform X3 [Ostrea edulis]|uniref:sperm flagellar protein 1-like isoform X3 n=1 Tax=Ostrea edulis TaxID=37623 RepID=UPI0024AFF26A|nr:sperm flagellar protein 1-like isoform X3 [Ostrea edulis]
MIYWKALLFRCEGIVGGMPLADYEDAELEELYNWVDSIPLSRPKKNIGRDFSDGVLVAEIVQHFRPKLIQMHNYTAASAVSIKKDNWTVLNRKVLSKLNFTLGEDVIRDVVMAKPGVIEKVLIMLRLKLERAEWELTKQQLPPKYKAKGGRRTESDKPEADQYMATTGRGVGKKSQSPTRGGIQRMSHYDRGLYDTHQFTQWPDYYPDQQQHKQQGPSKYDSNYIPRLLFEEKMQESLSKDETIKILQAKISRMEHLIHLKDVRIDDLQNRVETMRPTGSLVRR